MDDFPFVPPLLLQALDERFPNESADLKWSDREVWWRGGARSVIRFLQQQSEEQVQKALESKNVRSV